MILRSRLVPVNPKYYDIEKAFEENDIILRASENVFLALFPNYIINVMLSTRNTVQI